MKRSTLNFIREGLKTKGFFSTLHGLIYLFNIEAYIANLAGRTHFSSLLYNFRAKIYCIFKLKSKPISRHFFSDSYHAKVLPSAEAKTLLTLNRAVDIELSEEVLPYPEARQIILEEDCKIGVLECPCRATVSNPCYPLSVCIIMGNFAVDFALEHYKNKFRQINKTEAYNILEEAKKRGNVAHAFFKEAVLGRFYAICNCCTCCCAAMNAHANGLPMLASSGYLAYIDENLCKNCGKCQKICPFKAINNLNTSLENRQINQTKIDTTLCLGCKLCENTCQFGAIRYIAHPKVAKLEL